MLEGVVHALRHIHTALRPQGVLLDVHPEPQHALVELHRGDQIIAVGQIDETEDIRDITAARAALCQVIAEGLFVAEDEQTFEFVHHFDSVETWLAYRAERNSSGTIAEDVLTRGRALLAEAPGEICVRLAVRATRYRRA